MDKAVISEIYKMLQYVYRKPELYVAEDFPPIVNFINGFNTACYPVADQKQYEKARDTVLKKRGWSLSPAHPFREMSAKGMDDKAMTREILEIELEVWKMLSDS